MLQPIALTFVVGTIAAICFVVAALAPLAPTQRAWVALVGIVLDWVPVVAGWMTVEDPSVILLAVHFGFGIVGYVLLLYCLVGWLRNRDRSRRTRLAFVVIWGVAYLAGVSMAVGTILG